MSLYLGESKISGLHAIIETNVEPSSPSIVTVPLNPSIPNILFSKSDIALTIGDAIGGVDSVITTARVYSSALTPEQVKYRYQSSVQSDCAAMIEDTTYDTLSEAISAASAGDTVTVMAGNHGLQTVNNIEKNVTIVGKPGATLGGIVFSEDIEGITIKSISFRGTPINGFIHIKKASKNLTFKNCSFIGGGNGAAGIWSSSADTKYVQTNTVVDNCFFNLYGTMPATDDDGGASAILIQYADSLTVKDNYFVRVPYNGVQVTSGATGDITVINNKFYSIGSRNLLLYGIKDEYEGTLTIYGNKFSYPSGYAKETGNYVRLGLETTYYPIGENIPRIDEFDDASIPHFYNLGDLESSDIREISKFIDNEDIDHTVSIDNDIDSLIVDLVSGTNNDVYNILDDSSLIHFSTYDNSYPVSRLFMHFNDSSLYRLEGFEKYYSSIAQGVTLELCMELDRSGTGFVILDIGDSGEIEGLKVSIDQKRVPSFSVYVGGLNYTIATSNVAISEGVYHHLVGTYDGEYVIIYLDGEELGRAKVFDESVIINEVIESLPKYKGEVI